MSRPLLRAVVIAAAVVIAGCSNDVSSSSRATTPRAHAGKLSNILYVNPLPGDTYWDTIGTCMQTEAKTRGIALRVVGPPGGNVDFQAMHNLLSQAVESRTQAIATWSSGSSRAFDALFARARRYGGMVATLGSRGASRNQNFEVGNSAAYKARIRVRAVARRSGRQYIGAILQGRTGPDLAEYESALRDEVAKHRNLTLVDVQYNNGKFTKDVEIASTMLTRHPEITALINYSGFTGMLTAIKEQHRAGKVLGYMGSEDGQRGGVQGAADRIPLSTRSAGRAR